MSNLWWKLPVFVRILSLVFFFIFVLNCADIVAESVRLYQMRGHLFPIENGEYVYPKQIAYFAKLFR